MASVHRQLDLPVPVEQAHSIVSQQPGSRALVTPAPLPLSLAKRLHFIADSALKNGIHIVGGPGSGKSRLMGRVIGWQPFMRGKPVVVLDPTGGIVANIVDKISRLPLEQRRRLWPRIVYIDAGATDYVVPSPLYTRRCATETLFAAANRFPAVLKRQDPQLQSAPILGWNSLSECAIHGGKIALALGKQIDFMAELIERPGQFKLELRRALAQYPELAPAVSYFRELMDPNSGSLRERRTGSLRNKLLPFLADPTMLATFAAPCGGLDWDEVVEKGQLVIIDFQHEHDSERRQFKLIWWFRSFADYVKGRGMAGRGREIFFLIDEVTQLLGYRTGEGNSVLAEDLEEMVTVFGRAYGCNLVIAHQNLSQVDEKISNILMQLGTQMVGRISNPDDRYFLARYFFRYDPNWVKKREPVWMNLQQFDEWGRYMEISLPEVQDYRDVEFTPEEQLLKAMEMFYLPRFQFCVRPALAEGTISQRLYRLSIERMDAGQYPDDGEVARILALLRRKCGIPIEALLAEIHAQRTNDEDSVQKPLKPEPPPAILGTIPTQTHEKYEHPTDLSTAEDAVQTPPTPGGVDGEFWR